MIKVFHSGTTGVFALERLNVLTKVFSERSPSGHYPGVAEWKGMKVWHSLNRSRELGRMNHHQSITRMESMVMRILCFFGVVATLMLGVAQPAQSESKVYLVNGETRVGFVLVRFGRVTIRGVDRLFQHPEEAVHRIEHVTGETTLIGKEGILLREKPEKLSKTLVAIPKGCEVHVEDVEGDWVKIRVFAGRDEAVGYLHSDDLSDEVFFNFVDPTIRFRNPPPNLRDVLDREAIRRNMERMERLRKGLKETDFSAEVKSGTAHPANTTPEAKSAGSASSSP